jgi:hypothetical protein
MTRNKNRDQYDYLLHQNKESIVELMVRNLTSIHTHLDLFTENKSVL